MTDKLVSMTWDLSSGVCRLCLTIVFFMFRPRKKGAEEHYEKIPFVPIFDRIQKQNVGTLGIRAKHTYYSPPGLIRAYRWDFGVALNFTKVTVRFIWECVQLRGTAQLQIDMQSCRTRCQQVSAGLCNLGFEISQHIWHCPVVNMSVSATMLQQ